MGVLTYVVVSETRHADEICNDFLSDKFVWEDMPGLDLVLPSLYSMVTRKPLSEDLSDEFSMVFENDPDDGPWVRKAPDDFVLGLSEIEDGSISEFAKLWKDKDETFGRSPLKLVERLLRILQQSSREAIRNNKSLLIYQSL